MWIVLGLQHLVLTDVCNSDCVAAGVEPQVVDDLGAQQAARLYPDAECRVRRRPPASHECAPASPLR